MTKYYYEEHNEKLKSYVSEEDKVKERGEISIKIKKKKKPFIDIK